MQQRVLRPVFLMFLVVPLSIIQCDYGYDDTYWPEQLSCHAEHNSLGRCAKYAVEE